MITHPMLQFVIVIILLVSPIIPASSLEATDLETQTNREGSVTVKVTPKDLSPQAESWDFEIVFDTHTTTLDQDMRRMAVLSDGSETAQPPLAWDGDPPGGHHRKGVLRFQPLTSSPKWLELRINGIGSVSQRVFRWRLAE